MADMFDCGMHTRLAWGRDTTGWTWLRRTIGQYRDDVTREEIDAALDHDRITESGVEAFWRGWDAAGSQRLGKKVGADGTALERPNLTLW